MRRSAIALLAAVTLAGATAGCGGGSTGDSGQQKTILRLALNQTEKHPSYVALSSFSERLEKATDGRYTIDIFPNEVLGAQQEILNLMRNGIVDLAIISGTQLENINKDFQVFNLPAVFDSVEHQTKVINDPAITGGLFTSLEESNRLTVLGGFTQGERNLYTKSAVNTPADLAGKKIRVQESPVMLATIDAMGGSATPMAYGEVYTAMQSGVTRRRGEQRGLLLHPEALRGGALLHVHQAPRRPGLPGQQHRQPAEDVAGGQGALRS